MGNKIVFQYIFNLIKPFPGSIFLMVFVGIINAVDFSFKPYMLKIILNKIEESNADNIYVNLISPISIYLISLFLFSTILRLHGYFIDIVMIPKLRLNIVKSAFDRLLRQSHYYYQNTFPGALSNKINDLTIDVPNILHLIIDRFFSHGLYLIFATYTLWLVNVRFALLMLSWVVIVVIGALIFSKKVVHLANKWSELSSTNSGKMVDILSNILSIKLFSIQEQENLLLDSSLQRVLKAEQKLGWEYFWIFFVYGYSYILMIGFNIYFLVKGKQDGVISIGDFALVLTLNIAIVDFLWQIVRDLSQYSKSWGKVSQALQIMVSPLEVQDKLNAEELIVERGEIVFKKVQFSYKNSYKIFNNKSVIIRAGQKVGLVGYSGSGKSTFINLILRLYDISSGSILIDNQDITEVTQNSLRENVAMIPQDPSLFHRTIIDNIRCGKINASDNEVIEAAKLASAHDFIMDLSQGYDTVVGERGVKLSGGQRQRIAIARAILKNAPIWILDEATSQLDSITEWYIQNSLMEIIKNKTTIIIAHRLSTILRMDRILVFDNGCIIQDGNHQDLINSKGVYKRLWDSQVEGFIPDKKFS